MDEIELTNPNIREHMNREDNDDYQNRDTARPAARPAARP